MKDKYMNKNIFSEDIEVPSIVRIKAESVLASIRNEAVQGSMEENDMTKETKRRLFKSWTSIAAAAVIAVILGGGIVYAAINHFWSDGLNEVLEIDEEQMQTLEEQGNIQMFDQTEAVTVDDITVRPMEMVADRNSALVTFLISGMDEDIETADRLMFDTFHVELDEGTFSSAGARFYKNKVTDENGTEGFEYVVSVYSRGDGWSVELLGRKLHIELGNLATAGGKAEVGEVLTEGTWAFDISLPEEDPSITFDIEYPLSDTVYTVDQIMISPLSLQVYYQVNGEVEISRENNNVPVLYGVKMKDGTVIDLSSTLESGYPAFDRNLGSFLYDDPEEAASNEEVRLHPEKAFAQASFNKAIDPEEVAEVIIQPWGEAYAWGNLPDEIVAEEYGGEIPFERVDVDNIEYWNVPVE